MEAIERQLVAQQRREKMAYQMELIMQCHSNSIPCIYSDQYIRESFSEEGRLIAVSGDAPIAEMVFSPKIRPTWCLNSSNSSAAFTNTIL